jgi:hypothetical protein
VKSEQVGGCIVEVGRDKGEGNKVSSRNYAQGIYNARTCNQLHLLRYPHLDPPLDGTEVHRSRSHLKSYIAKSSKFVVAQGAFTMSKVIES